MAARISTTDLRLSSLVNFAPEPPLVSFKGVLVSYFSYLERCQFHKAAQVLEDALRMNSKYRGLSHEIVSPLLLFATSESVYYSMSYLHFKFLPKGFLANLYNQILADFNRVTAALDNTLELYLQHSKNNVSSTLATSLLNNSNTNNNMRTPVVENYDLDEKREESKFISHLFKEMCLIVLNRKKLLTIYMQLHASVKNNLEFDTILRDLTNIERQLPEVIHHPLLYQVKDNLASEVTLIHRLLEAEVNLSHAKLKESFLALNQTDVALESWHFKFGYDAEGTMLQTQLYKACCDLNDTLQSKFNFYFNAQLHSEECFKTLHLMSGITSMFCDMVEEFVQANVSPCIFTVSILPSTSIRSSMQPHTTEGATASNVNLHHSLPAAAHINPVAHDAPFNDKPLPVTYSKGKVLLKLLNVDWQVIHHILAKKFPSSGKRIRSQKPEYENHGRKHYFVLKMDKIVISMVQDTEDTGVIAQSIEFMERLQKKLNLTVLFENLGQ
jgi:hypothetical protein